MSAPKTVAPAEIEDAFIKANPGLSNSAVSVICDQRRLSEVRICMSKDLQFRSCEEIDRRACRRDTRGDAAGAQLVVIAGLDPAIHPLRKTLRED